MEWMLRYLYLESALPADRLFTFFQEQILTVSARLGLIGDFSAMTVAGDGTALVTSAYPRSKPTCNCRALGKAECSPFVQCRYMNTLMFLYFTKCTYF
ncbi:hypothetical protein [Paenibacillus nasutitermitis]|uniref:hypothetical protein n=1 Tax=Paenibacillus nasutitermitis TaxID=1652958 RepID=UPI001E3776BD|nr:hypothetical protein [Paenibacillus nasutitermitis]